MAETVVLSAAKFNSTKELLGYLDADVPGYSSYRNTYVVGLFGMAVLAIPLNAAVASLLIQRQFWRSNVYILLFQLAMANLLVAAFCMVGDAIWNITLQWFAGDVMCRFYKFLQMFSLYSSTFILTAISIDRCIAVLFPLSHSGARGRLTRVKIMSLAAWLISAMFAAPQAYIFHTELAPFQVDFRQCVTHGAYAEKWHEVAYNVFTVAVMFFVPVLIMLLCYVAIFARITKESQYASGPGDPHFSLQPEVCVRRALYSKARKTTLWMTLVFVLCFIVCWAPYYVGMFCFLLQIDIYDNALNSIFCFGMCSAIINPVIYGCFNFCNRRTGLHQMDSTKKSRPTRQTLLRRSRKPKNIYDPFHYMYAGERNPKLVITFKSYQNQFYNW